VDRGILEELCERTTKSVGKVVTYWRELLQHYLPHIIGMTPFRELYGYDAPTLIYLVFGDNRAPKAKN
jgi:hypothetical protein